MAFKTGFSGMQEFTANQNFAIRPAENEMNFVRVSEVGEVSEETYQNDLQNVLQRKNYGKYFRQEEIPVKMISKEPKTIQPEDDEEVASRKMVINKTEVIIETIKEKEREIAVNIHYDKVRTYKGVVEKMDIKYDKPKEDNRYSLKPQIILFGIVAVIAAILVGININGYIYAFTPKSTDSLDLIIASFTHESPLTLYPIYPAVFPAMGIVFLFMCFVGFIVIITASDRRAARVGREHGLARLAKPSDFKKYQKKFMEK